MYRTRTNKKPRPGNWKGRSSGGSGKVWQWSNSLAEPAHWEAGQLPCPGQAHATNNPTIITFQFLIQGAKRMRILVRICRHQKLDSDIKNILYAGNTVCNKTYRTCACTKAMLKDWKCRESKINANPCGSGRPGRPGSETLVYRNDPANVKFKP
jgi:hypothetical protein